jgi:hypothetical protein
MRDKGVVLPKSSTKRKLKEKQNAPLNLFFLPNIGVTKQGLSDFWKKRKSSELIFIWNFVL